MAWMRLGLGLPQFGPFADPDAVATVAAAAENLGFDSVWAGERVHAAAELLTPYPGGDGQMPDLFRASLDPVVTLTLAAAATTRVRLATSTLSAPLHPPVVLARQLAGIDQLSRGRLDIGLGLSWSRDEYEAVAIPWQQRGARLEETIDVLETLFAPDPVAHAGRFWNINPGQFQPKPVQQPRPPLFLGGFAAPAWRRIAVRADGWLGIALPVDQLSQVIDTIGAYAVEAGRTPAAIQTIVRINPQEPISRTGWLHDYLHALTELGVAEAFLDLQFAAENVTHLLEMAGDVRATTPTAVDDDSLAPRN